MASLRLWILTSVFLEIVVICSLVALPVYWVRISNLKNQAGEHLIWKLLACAFFFGVGAVSGLRWIENGLGGIAVDSMTAWFLPIVGAVYLHVAITHSFKQTLEISLFFLIVSYPAAMVRSELASFALSISALPE